MKKVTEKDCLLELERQVRILTDMKVDDEAEFVACVRKSLKGTLERLAQIRGMKEWEKEVKEAKRIKEKYCVRVEK